MAPPRMRQTPGRFGCRCSFVRMYGRRGRSRPRKRAIQTDLALPISPLASGVGIDGCGATCRTRYGQRHAAGRIVGVHEHAELIVDLARKILLQLGVIAAVLPQEAANERSKIGEQQLALAGRDRLGGDARTERRRGTRSILAPGAIVGTDILRARSRLYGCSRNNAGHRRKFDSRITMSGGGRMAVV